MRDDPKRDRAGQESMLGKLCLPSGSGLTEINNYKQWGLWRIRSFCKQTKLPQSRYAKLISNSTLPINPSWSVMLSVIAVNCRVELSLLSSFLVLPVCLVQAKNFTFWNVKLCLVVLILQLQTCLTALQLCSQHSQHAQTCVTSALALFVLIIFCTLTPLSDVQNSTQPTPNTLAKEIPKAVFRKGHFHYTYDM